MFSGRTDLPPEYVYPFAQAGSVLQPADDPKRGIHFSLGQQRPGEQRKNVRKANIFF